MSVDAEPKVRQGRRRGDETWVKVPEAGALKMVLALPDVTV